MVNILIIVFSIVFILIIWLLFYVQSNSNRISDVEKKSETHGEIQETLSSRVSKLKEEMDLGFKKSMKQTVDSFDKVEVVMKSINSYYEKEDTIVKNLTIRNKALDKKVKDVETEFTAIRDMVTTITINNNDMKEIKKMLGKLVDKQEK